MAALVVVVRVRSGITRLLLLLVALVVRVLHTAYRGHRLTMLAAGAGGIIMQVQAARVELAVVALPLLTKIQQEPQGLLILAAALVLLDTTMLTALLVVQAS